MLVRILYQVPEMFDPDFRKVRDYFTTESELDSEIFRVSARFTVLGWEYV